MVDEIKKKMESKMQKAIEALAEDFKSIRTGRASLAILDHVKIECYGQKMPINQLATMTVPEPRTIVIEPWDKTNLSNIEKGLQKSDINVHPVNDGKVIRLNFPPLTEERKLDFVKIIKNKTEETRVSIRNSRRDANEEIKKDEKNSEISKDESKKILDEIQKLTDKYIESVNKLLENKEKEIMEGR